MSKLLNTPKIRSYIHWLEHGGYRNVNCQFTYDDETYKLLDEIFDLLKSITPALKNGAWELWFQAERGAIEDYGDYKELKEDGEVDSFEEFVDMWKSEFPDEREWYNFSAIEDEELGYRAIFIGRKLVIEQDSRKEKSYPNDISEFAEWILASVQACITEIEKGTYYELVSRELPPQHRTGTITRKELWRIFPEEQEAFFSDITKEDCEEFIALATAQQEDWGKLKGRIPQLSANDFYSYCALGYQANNYSGTELPLKEQYFKHADGRDDGLQDIDLNSPEAFRVWYHDRERQAGHPWEVCRGGNSTHIDLRVQEDKEGYFLSVAGAAWGRSIEAVKFYLALRRAGLPVYIYEASALVDRLTGAEKVGIVPEGVFPRYCHSYFPNEHVIDFINLPFEERELVSACCVWQDLNPIKLMTDTGEIND